MGNLGSMSVEVELREIKILLSKLNRKIDVLMGRRETLAMMVLAEKSLDDFLREEPDLYSVEDVKERYH